jgi:hypothetical protein
MILVADPKTRLSLPHIIAHPWYMGDSTGFAGHVSEAAAAAGVVEGEGMGGMGGVEGDGGGMSPTEAQMAGAVQDHETAEVDFDDYVHEGAEPASLDAFDLVSHCGGFMLDKMFSPEIFYSVPGMSLSKDVEGGAPGRCHVSLS